MKTDKSTVWNEPSLAEVDPEVADIIERETQREHDTLRMIPSENYVSRAVLTATGSILTNKYSEGYPRKRYYEGQQNIDELEILTRKRLKALFGAGHANVQPYSGSPANLAALTAFAKAGDVIMGLGLPAGGHLTHGWSVSVTGQFFNSVAYGVRKEDHRIDFDEVRTLAREHHPKIIVCGATAYPRTIDFAKFREIADESGSILMADIAHIAGLVVGGVHPSPVGIADVVTSTTHKTFRGPRGGMILCERKHRKVIDKAVFPGLQGGPHNHTTAGIAVAAAEANTPAFKKYAASIVENAKALAEQLLGHDFQLVTGGTDNHLLLIDLTSKQVPGKIAAKALDRAGIVCNYNTIPFEPRTPRDPSGIRMGTPALTSRGMGPEQMKLIAGWIDEVVKDPENEQAISRINSEVQEMCAAFPAPGIRV